MGPAIPFALGAAVACGVALSRARVLRAQLAWGLFACAAAGWALGIGLAAAALALAGAAALPGSPRKAAGFGRTVVDGLIVGGSLLFVAWTLGLDHLYQHAAHARPLVVAGSLGNIVAASFALVALTRSRPAARPLLALVTVGLVGVAAGNSLQAVSTLGGSIDAGATAAWVVGWLLVAAAATRTARRAEEVDPGLPTQASVFVPSVPFAACVLAAARAAAEGRFHGFLVWNGAAVVVLIVMRQVLALVENISFWRDLERTVEARTDDLRRSEARFRSLVQNSSDVIVVIEAGGAIAYASPSAAAVFGHAAEGLRGRSPARLVHPDDLASARAAAADLLEHPGATTTLELRIRHSDSGWRDVEAIGGNLLEDPAVGGIVVNMRDITDRKELERQLTRRAFHDPLTELANRALFNDRLERAAARAERLGTNVSVLFLDLDDFKNVNDSLGHGAGDELLGQIARRLLEAVGPEPTVARLGGDEFAILLEDVDGDLAAARVAQRVLDSLEPPVAVGGREERVRGSVGIATSPAAGRSAEELLRNADLAMYRAKADGKGGYEVFVPSMRAALVERLELENDLRAALDRDQFVVHYQPIVALGSGRVRGAEALVRWNHPRHGIVPPGRFIDIAEATGLIVPIGRWVLETACREACCWQERHAGASRLTVSVNLSARQLEHPDLIDHVRAALDSSGLDPALLVLEITESMLIRDSVAAITRIAELGALGLRVALDDFGTGYSSLSYLRRLPVDILKVDRSFLDGVHAGSPAAALVRSIVEMTLSLGLVPIAEGVEYAPQAEELERMGCKLVQGFLFSKPVPAAEMRTLLPLSLAPDPTTESTPARASR